MTNKKEKPYSFWPSEAKQYGIEKAVIIYNLRHWLSVNQAAGKDMHCHDGYWWTYNTAKAFETLMPFFNRRSISRWLNELEESGFIKSGVFNAAGYDRTKWYTIPSEFSDGAIGQNDSAICHNDQAIGQNDSPIPVVNPVEKPDVNHIGTSADAPCSVCCGNGFIVDDMGHGMYRDVPCHNCSGTGKEPTCNDGLQVRNGRTTEPTGNTGELPRTDKPSKTEQATQAPAENSKQDGSAATDKQRNRYPEEFEWLWTHKPERLGGNGKKSAYNACRARIKDGATWREMAEGLKRYAAHCKADGKLNTPYVMQMATFFGPDEHYKASWGNPQQSAQVGAVSPTQEPRAALASELTPEQLAATRERLKNMMKGA